MHEDVDWSDQSRRGARDPVHRALVADVGWERVRLEARCADACRRPFQFVHAARDQRHARSAPGQLVGECRAQALARPGDQSTPSSYVHRRILLRVNGNGLLLEYCLQ